jgi:hypothetical protein
MVLVVRQISVDPGTQDLFLKSEKLAETFSKSFCFAKWYHANINLQLGETNSCYHPPPHPIDQSLLEDNPSAIHNTPVKLEEREQMLDGARPPGCQYCWNIENLGKGLLSDRHVRNGSMFNPERIREIQKIGIGSKTVPTYIEVSFGNECNFKCGYCHPKYSSRYKNEIKQFGPYPNVLHHSCDVAGQRIYSEDENPILESWWRWWDEIKGGLRIFRITGGEPLIQKSTQKLLESIENSPLPHLELNINSNFGSSSQIVQHFCRRVEGLVSTGKIARFKLFTSIDTWGSQAEYIRTGLSLPLFESNLKTYLTETSQPVTFMVTFNLFSLVRFRDLLEKILEIRSVFQWDSPLQLHRLNFDISYLREPIQYDIQILPKDQYLPLMENHLEFIRQNVNNKDKSKFTEIEYEKFRRIYEYMKNTHYESEKIRLGRRDFWNFFKEQDRRRGTSLHHAFPEMADFFEQCEQETQL